MDDIVQAGLEVSLDEWVAPELADEHDHIRAGKLLEWMDVVGVLAATRHCRRPVVTASLDGLELRDPIAVGERVTMTASVAYTSPRSIGVSVTLRHGSPHEGRPRKALSGYMTFVALDDEGRPAPVPQVRPDTPAAMARYREGQLRAEFRRKLPTGEVVPGLPMPAGPAGIDRPLLMHELLRRLPLPLQPVSEAGLARRPPAHSYVHKIEPVRESKLNFHGTLYGGTLMRWLETSAQLSARSHQDGEAMRLVGLHGLTFLRPVQRHRFVHIRSGIAHTGADSLTALVNVHAEDPLSGEEAETLRAFLTYQPVGRIRPRVHPLECVGEEERAVFEEVERRLALQRTLRDGEGGRGETAAGGA